MNTLADAWKWYEATKVSLARMRRLGEKHWADASLDRASIWQDDRFRTLDAASIVTDTEISLKLVDDLAIIVLFSVFESSVRDYLIETVGPQAARITEPILRQAVDDAIQGLREGSFYRRVLEPLKRQGKISADLITQVDQVRAYRNWVAHGRRESADNNVTPLAAYSRLREFLSVLGIAAESEQLP